MGISDATGLVVLYRWRVADADVAAFAACWGGATEDLRQFGAQGSLLAHGDDGCLWAIAKWPDKSQRQLAERDYIDTADWQPSERLQTIMLDPIENRWN